MGNRARHRMLVTAAAFAGALASISPSPGTGSAAPDRACRRGLVALDGRGEWRDKSLGLVLRRRPAREQPERVLRR